MGDCGEPGSQYRNVSCLNGTERVPESSCHNAMPSTVKACMNLPCPIWMPKRYGPCQGTPCIRERNVTCERGNEVVQDGECDAENQPASAEQCDLNECITAEWIVSEFGTARANAEAEYEGEM